MMYLVTKEDQPSHPSQRGVAQRVAHSLWKRKVVGSNPTTPTNLNRELNAR